MQRLSLLDSRPPFMPAGLEPHQFIVSTCHHGTTNDYCSYCTSFFGSVVTKGKRSEHAAAVLRDIENALREPGPKKNVALVIAAYCFLCDILKPKGSTYRPHNIMYVIHNAKQHSPVLNSGAGMKSSLFLRGNNIELNKIQYLDIIKNTAALDNAKNIQIVTQCPTTGKLSFTSEFLFALEYVRALSPQTMAFYPGWFGAPGNLDITAYCRANCPDFKVHSNVDVSSIYNIGNNVIKNQIDKYMNNVSEVSQVPNRTNTYSTPSFIPNAPTLIGVEDGKAIVNMNDIDSSDDERITNPAAMTALLFESSEDEQRVTKPLAFDSSDDEDDKKETKEPQVPEPKKITNTEPIKLALHEESDDDDEEVKPVNFTAITTTTDTFITSTYVKEDIKPIGQMNWASDDEDDEPIQAITPVVDTQTSEEAVEWDTEHNAITTEEKEYINAFDTNLIN